MRMLWPVRSQATVVRSCWSVLLRINAEAHVGLDRSSNYLAVASCLDSCQRFDGA